MRWVGLPFTGIPLTLAYRPVKGDGGAVVVELAQIDTEDTHRMEDDVRQHGSAIGEEERVQAAPDTVIVEQLGTAGRQAEDPFIEAVGPLAQPVQWLARDQDVA